MIKVVLEFMSWKDYKGSWDWAEIRIDIGTIILGTLLVAGAVHYG